MTEGPQQAASPGKGEPDAAASAKPAWTSGLPSIESTVVDGRRRIVYTGPSMNPTLREPDFLWVEPYGDRRVRAGDVVCFESPEHKTNVVHRVISVRPRSPVTGLRSSVSGPPSPVAIRTRGDNNPLPDTRVLAFNDLIGRVVAAQRGPRVRPVPGGCAGQAIAWSVRLQKPIGRILVRVISGAYQALARSAPLYFLLPVGLRPRLVCFSGRDAPVFKLLIGGRTVGHYDYRFNRWQIRRPLRLIIDEHSLPVPGSGVRSSDSRVPGPRSGVQSPTSGVTGR